MFYQLIYISTVTPGAVINLTEILRVSQLNNVRQAITGLLFFNGRRFLQALEGDRNAVEAALKRIRADGRHRAIVVLSERDVAGREFGSWAMADATTSGDAGAMLARIERLVANASPSVQATFASYARVELDVGSR